MELNIKWNEQEYKKFISYLKSISDNKYLEFNKKIVSSKYQMLGIKIPVLRVIAKNIMKGDYEEFLRFSDDSYYEVVLIKGLIIASIKEIDKLEEYFDRYLELIDNWALCDTFCSSLKIVNKNKEYFMGVIERLLESSDTYRVRVGFVLLLNYYVEEEYLDLIFEWLDKINVDDYYINMAEAWLLCEVFTKYQEEALKYIENNKLNKFTINKTISKIRDSYRVDKSMKDYILRYKK